jgi:hypothetical protein
MKTLFQWIFGLVVCSVFVRWVLKQQKASDASKSERSCKLRNYEYFESVYYNEEKRKDGLMPVMSFTLAVIGIIGSFLTFYFRDIVECLIETPYKTLLSDYWVIGYLVFVGLATVSLFTAGVYFIRSFFNYTYRYLPPPLELLNYYHKLLQAHKDIQVANDEFQEYLTNEYAEVANNSDEKYIRRRKFLHLSTRYSIFAFIFMALACMPFLANKAQHPKKPINVMLQNDSILLNTTSPLFQRISLDIPFGEFNLISTLTPYQYAEKIKSSGNFSQTPSVKPSSESLPAPAAFH